jgi:hypothetical protein
MGCSFVRAKHPPKPPPIPSLTQVVGGSWFPVTMKPYIAADVPLAPGETLLLSSDGLWPRPLLQNAVQTGIELRIDPNPRLIVFRFDAGQRDGRRQASAETSLRPNPTSRSMRPGIPKPRRAPSSLRGQMYQKSHIRTFFVNLGNFSGPRLNT